MPYKRNQIEEAIGRIFHPDSEKQLLTRLMRLAASIGPKILKKPTLHFSARTHLVLEPIFHFPSTKSSRC